MKSHCELTRRQLIAATAKSCLGVSIGGTAASLFSNQALGAPDANARAKNVIYLFMSGGLTHIDTFDPKPEASSDIRGPLGAISTNVDGIQLGEKLPLLAKQADKFSLVRSMNSTQGAHKQGRYFMRTGYTPNAAIIHPSAGGWVRNFTAGPNGRSETTIPGYVTVGCGNRHPGSGFFEPVLQPLPVGKAGKLSDSKRGEGISDEAFQQQLKLRKALDADFDGMFSKGQQKVRAYDSMFDEALTLMKSEDLKAFDISTESKKTQQLYGDSTFGRGALLARRLVEHGVRFVEVELGGFDWHGDNFGSLENRGPVIDRVISGLLEDLAGKGLLETTMVIVATEFGRTPRVRPNGGRDHYPKAFSLLFAGGGIKGGFVHGMTDENAENVLEGKVNAMDVNATIGSALGLPFDETVYSATRRPFQMSGRNGQPIHELFA